MSHEFETGMFVGQPAWHGLGNMFATPPTLQEALIASGLTWTVGKRPATRVNAAGNVVEIKGAYELYRESDDTHFAFCGSKFQAFQNAKAFDWFQPIIDSGAATIEAAGSLHGGKKVWVLAAVKDAAAEVVKDDLVKHYVLFANGHDGRLSIKCGFTSVRVVCQNTLSAALGRKSSKLLSVRHTAGAKLQMDKIRDAFDIERGELQSQASLFKMLAAKKCDDATMVAYAREVLSPGAKEDATVRNLQKPIDNFAGAGLGSDMPGVRGTMWGAFNAVTQFITHDSGRSANNRVDSGWFGANRARTERALSVAVEMADNLPAADMARECSRNTALATASFADLLGGSANLPQDTGANDFARLLG